MKKTIRITLANPAGNKTIFVHDKFERSDYAKVAEQLLAMDEFAAEQVAFILDAPECGRAEGKMEMCGLEFCGNATRTFGLMVARRLGIAGPGKVYVDVSGADEILTVEVNTDTNYTKVKMPAYIDIKRFDLSKVFDEGSGAELSETAAVDFGGILHLILPNIPASRENFEKLKNFVYSQFDPPAMGAMFYDGREKKLTPVVYVKDVDSTYFEGSCASGSAACAIAFGLAEDGRRAGRTSGDGRAGSGNNAGSDDKDAGKTREYAFELVQPAGTINASVKIRGGRATEVYIEGPVKIAEPVSVAIEI